MNFYGHATPDEKQHVQELEARVNAETSPLDQILELALNYIEPCHREDQAVSLLQEILKREPEHSAAKIWISYCCRWALMSPEWQHYAQGLLQEVVAREPNPELIAGAYYMMAQLESELAFPKWNAPEVVARQIELLQASIKHAPHWFYNHFMLAWLLKDSGRLAEAIEEMQTGIDNIIEPDPHWDAPTLYFEAYITWRLAKPDSFQRDLDKIKAEL
jgi:hypothetical protein